MSRQFHLLILVREGIFIPIAIMNKVDTKLKRRSLSSFIE